MNELKIKTVKRQGLTREEARLSAERHGKNILTAAKRKGFLAHFLENLGDPVIKILLFALAINLFFVFRGGDIAESIGIAISVFLATFISTLSERGSEAAFRRLSEECASSAYRVRRDGGIVELPISEIVVGDCVLIGAGENIPADGFIYDGSLRVDQSSLTGESREIEKRISDNNELLPSAGNALFRGCPILSGEAEFEVAAVGDSTFLGEISHEIQLDTRESPLKLRLAKLAKQISRLGYLAALLVALATLFNTFVIDSGFNPAVILMKLRDIPYLLENLLHAFMLGLTVIVVAVPEGLPMMIAVVLSSNIWRMMRDNVLVRKPMGIEAAGSMNILFTDKTGTLTEGKMSVSRIVLADGEEFTSIGALRKDAPYEALLYELSCRKNTTAVLSADGESILGGNATERALLASLGAHKDSNKYEVLWRLPFDSERKYSIVTVSDGKRTLTLVKGAPERILPHISFCSDGRSFSPLCSYFTRRIAELTRTGGRVLLLAFCEGSFTDGSIPSSLDLISAVVLEDKLRGEAKHSVEELRGAGIQVVMLTGDNVDTARSIAKKCGILNSTSSLVLDGDELSKLSDDALKRLLPRLAVVARVLPADKSRLVRIAQECELVVGMTGDGINDAPALKRADIGFAMGNGTQVARDAGDIIILDNNLASIAKAVLHGRNIFKSIRKFITLQLTMNFSAVGVSMIGPFIGFDAPVTVVQMLWINIIMDTLGGLAFAGEAALPHCMKEKPKRRDEPILNGYMVNQIVVLGSFTIALCLAFLKLPLLVSRFRFAPNNIYLLTAFFTLFIFASLFNCFNSRTDRLRLFSGLSKNRAFIAIMLLVGTIQILFTYLGGSVLRTSPLLPSELLTTMLLALLVFPVELLRKLLWRLFGKKDGF